MKVLLIHNEYATFSGEEAVVADHESLLRKKGCDVVTFKRSSAEIADMWLGPARAFFAGVYSFESRRRIRRLLAGDDYHLAHIHNVFPLISPAVLGACHAAGVPVVMTLHNYRLVCPNGLHMRDGRICEECCGGAEYRCLLRNCEQNIAKSAGYALRTWLARQLGFFRRHVTLYLCLTAFQRARLIAAGYPAERMLVIPNPVVVGEAELKQPGPGEYVGYIGRISPEKGLRCLVDAAGAVPDIPFVAAGSFERQPQLLEGAPRNFRFVGAIPAAATQDFYAAARMVVLPSSCFEGFPRVLIEAMAQQKPIICSRIGGLPEIVDDGVTGLLFEPGNAAELSEKIRYLWQRPETCRQMGLAGRQKVLREYSIESYCERLTSAYRTAIALGPGGSR
jgi:glycosyltransferase involved in cell wall biosynthesis